MKIAQLIVPPLKVTHDPTFVWPKGYEILEGKLYLDERLCVPTGKVVEF